MLLPRHLGMSNYHSNVLSGSYDTVMALCCLIGNTSVILQRMATGDPLQKLLLHIIK